MHGAKVFIHNLQLLHQLHVVQGEKFISPSNQSALVEVRPFVSLDQALPNVLITNFDFTHS
jgi:hypothetical protein